MKDERSISRSIGLARKTCKSKLHEIHLQVIEGKLYLLQNRYYDYEKLMQKCIDYYFLHKSWENLKNVAVDFSHYFAEKKQYKKAYELSQICLIANENIHKNL